MCGINGIYNFAKISLSEEETLVKKMNQAIKHRGPDDNGIWCDRKHGVYLGHQRLSILDLSPKGHQPMINSNGTVIVYNGETYNFKSLKAEFCDHSFFSKTDTEVLLYLYDQCRDDWLDRLRGMFAFAIWDKTKKELFLARDRIGIKPLYYTTRNGIFAFSSEIKALLALPWVRAEVDEVDLYHFLTFNKTFPPKTMFKDIYKFHPGHRMVVGENGIKVYEAYWEIQYSDYSSLSTEDLIELILKEIKKSVKEHMVSDVPVGAFLSGGVDSSAIVAFMSKRTSSPIKTYSIGFHNAPDYDELRYAKKISKQFGTEHFEKIIHPQDITDFLPKVVDIFDEPLADAPSIPIYFISKLARENGTIVVLTGDGGDELFCGYSSWVRYAKLYPFYRHFSKLPKCIISAVANICGSFWINSIEYEILNRAEKGREFFWGDPGGFKESTKRSFLSSDFIRRIGNTDSYNQILYFRKLFESISRKSREFSYVDWLCFLGLKAIIPNYYLYRADHLSMAHSVEIRVPYLDHNFVNLALSILGKWKIHNGEPKYILKKSLERFLPREILYRKKQGFCVPQREWTAHIILDYVEKNLKSFCRDTGLFNEEGLKKQIIQTKKGKPDYTFTLWNIYFLMSWFKKWIL